MKTTSQASAALHPDLRPAGDPGQRGSLAPGATLRTSPRRGTRIRLWHLLRPVGSAVALTLVASLQADMVVFDNFDDDRIGPAWAAYTMGNGPSIREANGRLEASLPASSSQTVPDGFGAFCQSVFKLQGDFDLQIAFELLTWPENNGARVGFGIAPWYGANRASIAMGMQDGYAFSAGGGTFTVPSSDKAGRLRLARTGTTLTGYYWKSSDWAIIGSGSVPRDDFGVSLGSWSHDGYFSHQDVRVGLDGFMASAASIDGMPEIPAVPEPAETGLIAAAICALAFGFQHARSYKVASTPCRRA